MILALCTCFSFAQDYPLTDSLKRNLEQAKTPGEKIIWLGELSSFYRQLNDSLSKRYTKEMMEIAEMSRDREVMLKALLMQANSYYNNGGTAEFINKGKALSKQALELAKSSQLDEYIAWGYIYMARGARNEGQNDNALNYNHLAVSISSLTENDSLKISALNSLGNTYLNRKEKLLAFRSYLQALNLAENARNVEQLKNSYYAMSNFYADLSEYEKSKDYLFKALALTRKHALPYDRMEAYNAIGSMYSRSKNTELATYFFEQAMALSDTLGLSIFKINVYGRMIDMYIFNDQPEKALQYFNEKRALRDFMEKAGVGFFANHAYGVVYTEMGKYDSAIYHLKIAEKGFETKANQYNRYFLYTNFASYYFKTKEYKKALEYLQKARAIGEARGDIQILQNMSASLDSVYQKLGDYRSAHHYNAQYHLYKDSIQSLEAEKDLLALEVDSENRKKQRELEAEVLARNERHNIQYMGITAAIGAVFILLVMFGAFSVSKTTIRIVGFFAFIFLFEFIILIADHKIHDATHGEPWKILAIKIVLISMLLPLHHYLEKKVIHFLTERKLMQGDAKALLYKIAGKTDPTIEQVKH